MIKEVLDTIEILGLDNIATFIAAIAAILSAIISFFNSKKVLKQQEELHNQNIQHNEKVLVQQKELNNKNFQGNIVSNARIEWIQEVRKKSVDFISACHDFFRYTKANNNNIKRLIELKSEIEKSGTLLILYFGPSTEDNKNNDMIELLITNLIVKITNKNGYYDNSNILELEYQVDILRDFLRIYLKAEWMRANRGISDDDVQKYLQMNDIYNKIINIYTDALTCHKEWVDDFYSQMEDKLDIK